MGMRELEGRNGEIWRAYVAGETQESLARRYGLDQSRVSQICAAVKAKLPPEDLEARRVRLLEVLDEGMARMTAIVRAEPVPLYSNGKPVLNPDGSVAQDWTGQANALKAVLAVQERMARMLGTDAPARTDVTLHAAETEAALAAGAAAAARLAGPSTGDDGSER